MYRITFQYLGKHNIWHNMPAYINIINNNVIMYLYLTRRSNSLAKGRVVLSFVPWRQIHFAFWQRTLRRGVKLGSSYFGCMARDDKSLYTFMFLYNQAPFLLTKPSFRPGCFKALFIVIRNIQSLKPLS